MNARGQRSHCGPRPSLAERCGALIWMPVSLNDTRMNGGSRYVSTYSRNLRRGMPRTALPYGSLGSTTAWSRSQASHCKVRDSMAMEVFLASSGPNAA